MQIDFGLRSFGEISAAMAANVWNMQRCTGCCSCGTFASPGFGSFDFSESSLYAANGLSLRMNTKRGGKQHSRSISAARSYYSPLVESFESKGHKSRHGAGSAKDTNNPSELITISRSGSVLPGPASENLGTSREQHGARSEEGQEGNDDMTSPEDPIAAAYGDDTPMEKIAEAGHDLEAKKGARSMGSPRSRPPSMSLSQTFSTAGRHAVTHTVGAVGRPLSSGKIKGPAGVLMALAVAALGLKTAAEKQGLLPNTPQKVCGKCDGYGVQQCHVCKGQGILVWEGKLLHTDPCPLCFGSCVKKCSNCGGIKMKKGMPPNVVAQLSGSRGKGRSM